MKNEKMVPERLVVVDIMNKKLENDSVVVEWSEADDLCKGYGQMVHCFPISVIAIARPLPSLIVVTESRWIWILLERKWVYSSAHLQYIFSVLYRVKLIGPIWSVELESCKPQQQYKYQYLLWKEN